MIQVVVDNGSNYKMAGKNSIILNKILKFIVITFNCYFTHQSLLILVYLGKILEVTRKKKYFGLHVLLIALT